METCKKKQIRKQILEDRFEVTRKRILLPIVVNGLLSLFFLLFFMNSPQLPYTIASMVLVLLFYLIYDWRRVELNSIITILYVLILLMEIILPGFPGQMHTPEHTGKGVFIDLMQFLSPYIYAGLRMLAIVPLISIIGISRKLAETKDQR